MNQALKVPSFIDANNTFNSDIYVTDRDILSSVAAQSAVLDTQNKEKYISNAQIGMFLDQRRNTVHWSLDVILIAMKQGLTAWNGFKHPITKPNNSIIFDNEDQIKKELKDSSSFLKFEQLDIKPVWSYVMALLDEDKNIVNVVNHDLKGVTGEYAQGRWEKEIARMGGPLYGKIFNLTSKIKRSQKKQHRFALKDIEFLGYVQDEETFKELEKLSSTAII